MVRLPSEVKWVEKVADDLLDGVIVLTRGLPRTGKTELAKAVVALLGESAILVSGKQFSEETQAAQRENLKAQVEQTVSTFGAAQVVFDDYGSAIKRSQGGVLHSMLYGLLIDGPLASDIGVLLTSRFEDDLSLRFAGSPLLSRARTVPQPMLHDEDAAILGLTLSDLVHVAGSTTSLARRLGDVTSQVRTYEILEYLKADAPAPSADLPAAAVEVMLGARAFDDADPFAQQALLTFGNVDDSKGFMMARAVADSGLCEDLRVRGPGWPSSRSDSVALFVEMLAGVEMAYWVDRYLCTDVASLRDFLTEVRKRIDTRLRLITCDSPGDIALAPAVVSNISAIAGVEVRFMTHYDRRDLHDRHLALPALQSGFVLPTSGVITSRDSPGSAVAVRMPDLPVDYSKYWQRATRLD